MFPRTFATIQRRVLGQVASPGAMPPVDEPVQPHVTRLPDNVAGMCWQFEIPIFSPVRSNDSAETGVRSFLRFTASIDESDSFDLYIMGSILSVLLRPRRDPKISQASVKGIPALTESRILWRFAVQGTQEASARVYHSIKHTSAFGSEPSIAPVLR